MLISSCMLKICRQLALDDLFNLARTSSSIRNVLLSPAARYLWTAARPGMDVEIFSGMRDIDFAVLLYGSMCHVRAFTPWPVVGLASDSPWRRDVGNFGRRSSTSVSISDAIANASRGCKLCTPIVIALPWFPHGGRAMSTSPFTPECVMSGICSLIYPYLSYFPNLQLNFDPHSRPSGLIIHRFRRCAQVPSPRSRYFRRFSHHI